MSIILDGTDGITTPSVTYEGDATINGLTVGRGAGDVATNTAVGASALVANTSGANNVAIGTNTLDANTSGASNTGVGANSLDANTTGGSNSALGYLSLFANTTGTNNSALGRSALEQNTTGGTNTAVGANALKSNTTASNNTAVGYQAGYAITTGFANVFIGNNAGDSATIASGSVFIGTLAGQSVTTGIANTLVGGSYGNYAGGSLTTGSLNTFIGTDAGGLMTTGSGNTIIGAYDGNEGGLDIRTSSNNIVLSDGAGNPRVFIDGNGNLMVGGTHAAGRIVSNTTGTYPFVARNGGGTSGYFGLIEFRNNADNGAVGSIVRVNDNSVAYNTSSDYRLKEDWVAVADASTRVNALKPVNFAWIASGERVDGFLAHELAEVVPEAVTGEKDAVDAEGNPVYQGIDQSKLVPLLTAALQEALAEINSLKARLDAANL